MPEFRVGKIQFVQKTVVIVNGRNDSICSCNMKYTFLVRMIIKSDVFSLQNDLNL